jgi:sugar (pentulose or hexulose) kinase
MLDIVSMQVISLNLAKGSTHPEKVFISGGFCDNPLFMQLLASYFPDIDFYTTRLKKASALGAALVMHRQWNRNQPIDHLFDNFEKVPPCTVESLQAYQLTGKQVVG